MSLVAGIPLLFLIGFAIQRFLTTWAFKQSMEARLIIAFGISLVLEHVYQIIFSPMSRGISTSYSMKSFIFGGIYIPIVYVLNFIVALLVMVSLHTFLESYAALSLPRSLLY